ncbi:elongation factor Tu-like [Oppia nitens]|uniref:elongation factor Tu-like n=1 Tax=Oppia nitens TaxID=1686743 RepID=UPI0023DB0D09|nr:elongation factor Tu-like [Oppia nitens]
MLDGCPGHFATITRDWLDTHLPNRWIGRGSPFIKWPPRSPDVTPMDFSIWGIVRDDVAVRIYENVNELKQSIEYSFSKIDVLNRYLAIEMDGAILVVAGSEGQMPQTREHLMLSKQIGVKKLVVFVNKCDLIDDKMKELVEMEVRDLLNNYGFDGDNTPFLFGSALAALSGDKSGVGEESIIKLLDTLDSYITPPERDTNSPFLMPIMSTDITRRGIVCIGTVEKGIIARGDPIDIIGWDAIIKSVAIS